MMAGEREAVEAVKQARRRVGFAIEPPVQKRLRLPDGWQKVIADAFAAGTADLIRKLTARPSSGAESPREEIHRPGVEGGDLRKSSGYGGAVERDLARAHRQGVAAGDALVAGARARKAAATVAVPTGAVADAENTRNRLRDVVKATPEYRNDARLAEASQLAEALATPPTRVAYMPPDPVVAQPWEPHAGHEAAAEGAASLMGCTPEEYASALRDAVQGAPGHLDRLTEQSVVAAVKAAKPLRCGQAPPRFSKGA